MRRLTRHECGTRQIRTHYFWTGVSYPMDAVRVRYGLARSMGR